MAPSRYRSGRSVSRRMSALEVAQSPGRMCSYWSISIGLSRDSSARGGEEAAPGRREGASAPARQAARCCIVNQRCSSDTAPLDRGGRLRRERRDTQHAAVPIHRGRNMHIRVRINTARHRARGLYDGHRHPFSAQRIKGWHARPAKETVSSTLVSTASSVTLRNGACPIPTQPQRTYRRPPTTRWTWRVGRWWR